MSCSEAWDALYILEDALDYLKGKDIQGRFSHTQEFFTDLTEWVEELQEAAKPDLVQIEGANGSTPSL